MATQRIQHIVAGVGLTESSLVPVREALRLGARLGARVSAVHVTREVTPEQQQAFERHLAAITSPDGVEMTPVVLAGTKIAAALSEFATSNDAQLLCVGPKVHGFVERHITGSPAEQLVSLAEIPVLVVRDHSQPYHRVLVALDLSPASARALQVSLALTERDPAAQRLHVLHVLSARSGAHRVAARDLEKVVQAMQDNARVRIQSFLEQHLSPEEIARCEVDVRVGVTGRQLVDAIERIQPQLVSMGTIGRRGLHGLLAGNTAERMVRTLNTPMLVAHPPATT